MPLFRYIGPETREILRGFAEGQEIQPAPGRVYDLVAAPDDGNWQPAEEEAPEAPETPEATAWEHVQTSGSAAEPGEPPEAAPEPAAASEAPEAVTSTPEVEPEAAASSPEPQA